MFKAEEQLSIQQKAEQLALPSPEEQAKIACQTKMTKGTPEGWTYKNVNAIFYNPEGVELRYRVVNNTTLRICRRLRVGYLAV